jgi:hypothetical protein
VSLISIFKKLFKYNFTGGLAGVIWRKFVFELGVLAGVIWRKFGVDRALIAVRLRGKKRAEFYFETDSRVAIR